MGLAHTKPKLFSSSSSSVFLLCSVGYFIKQRQQPSASQFALSLFPSRCVRVAKEIKRTAETLPLFSWTATHLSHHFFSSLLLELHHKRKPKRK
jgi:hypothetical protein